MQNKLLHIFYENSNLILKVLFQQLCHCHTLIVLSNQFSRAPGAPWSQKG